MSVHDIYACIMESKQHAVTILVFKILVYVVFTSTSFGTVQPTTLKSGESSSSSVTTSTCLFSEACPSSSQNSSLEQPSIGRVLSAGSPTVDLESKPSPFKPNLVMVILDEIR